MRVVWSSETPRTHRASLAPVSSKGATNGLFSTLQKALPSPTSNSWAVSSPTIVPFVSWRVEGAPDFRYIQQLATETEFDVCGAGCATFVKGELPLHSATGDDSLRPYSRYAWKGNADGRGRFVRVR